MFSRPRCTRPATVVLALLLCVPCWPARAQDPTAVSDLDIESQRSLEAEKDAKAEVRRYAFSAGTGQAGDGPWELHPQPILKWSNPAAGSLHGNVFLWTQAGRPRVAGSLYQWFSPFTHRAHEFVSLATTPLRADYAGAEVWRTNEPGIVLAPLPQSPLPAASASLRLVQMRALVRQFSATKLDREGDQQELRVLTQPVYRYRPTAPQLIDGALFVFVQGTDPEVWLMLEAREHQGQPRWEFAAARMNSVDLVLRRNGTPLWHAEVISWGDVYAQRLNYTSFRFKEAVE